MFSAFSFNARLDKADVFACLMVTSLMLGVASCQARFDDPGGSDELAVNESDSEYSAKVSARRC
jgi:hypothetical protein